MADTVLSLRALNRALLARQGLLTPLGLSLADGVEAIGAIQAQQWAAPPVALWTRLRDVSGEQIRDAASAGEIVAGSLLRGTLHLVSAREHAEYATVAAASGACEWRTKAELGEGGEAFRTDLRAFAAKQVRTVAEISEFADAWVDAHPGAVDPAEVTAQRERKWRPLRITPELVRASAKGRWDKEPKDYRAAPAPLADDVDAALGTVVRRHLRAFGPASAEDVAYWIGWRVPAVRSVLDGDGELARYRDEHGRMLYDLPDTPLPPEDAEAPVRFLAGFDSALLAYHAQRRDRILPPKYKDAVYVRANLQVRPTLLVDGFVAGTWSADGGKRSATVTVVPTATLTAAVRKQVVAEGEELAGFLYPGAAATVAFGD